SLSDVATFRFSSVDNSYAGRKGKARNVGVIAVAIFEEAAPPPEQQIVVGGSYRGRWDVDAAARDRAPRGAAEGAPSARPAPPPAVGGYAKAEAPASAPRPAITDGRGGYYEPPAPTV